MIKLLKVSGTIFVAESYKKVNLKIRLKKIFSIVVTFVFLLSFIGYTYAMCCCTKKVCHKETSCCTTKSDSDSKCSGTTEYFALETDLNVSEVQISVPFVAVLSSVFNYSVLTPDPLNHNPEGSYYTPPLLSLDHSVFFCVYRL